MLKPGLEISGGLDTIEIILPDLGPQSLCSLEGVLSQNSTKMSRRHYVMSAVPTRSLTHHSPPHDSHLTVPFTSNLVIILQPTIPKRGT